jgi:prepilin-type N-terminal cleavage/methylation domain-containing protein
MSNNRFKISNSGMTMIELLIAVSIFLVITGITVFGYSDFRSKVSLQNLIGDIALTIRSVQSYAIGVIGKEGDFSSGYGLHFSTGTSGSNSPYANTKSFIIFQDMNDNNLYDIPEDICTDECDDIINISGLSKIVGIYLKDSTVPIESTASLDISFKRPNPDALFCYRWDPSSDYCDWSNEQIQYARIVLSNGLTGEDEITKTVKISNTGQISIE